MDDCLTFVFSSVMCMERAKILVWMEGEFAVEQLQTNVDVACEHRRVGVRKFLSVDVRIHRKMS